MTPNQEKRLIAAAARLLGYVEAGGDSTEATELTKDLGEVLREVIQGDKEK